MAGPYIVDADFTDLMIIETGFDTARAAKITLSTAAVEKMALKKGVEADDIETDPVDQTVQDWAVAWVGMEMCWDAMGKNNLTDVDRGKYAYKYEEYRKRLKDLTDEVTKGDLLGETDTVRDMANTMVGTIYRS